MKIKKLLTFVLSSILAIGCIFGLTACGGTEEDKGSLVVNQVSGAKIMSFSTTEVEPVSESYLTSYVITAILSPEGAGALLDWKTYYSLTGEEGNSADNDIGLVVSEDTLTCTLNVKRAFQYTIILKCSLMADSSVFAECAIGWAADFNNVNLRFNGSGATIEAESTGVEGTKLIISSGFEDSLSSIMTYTSYISAIGTETPDHNVIYKFKYNPYWQNQFNNEFYNKGLGQNNVFYGCAEEVPIQDVFGGIGTINTGYNFFNYLITQQSSGGDVGNKLNIIANTLAKNSGLLAKYPVGYFYATTTVYELGIDGKTVLDENGYKVVKSTSTAQYNIYFTAENVAMAVDSLTLSAQNIVLQAD